MESTLYSDVAWLSCSSVCLWDSFWKMSTAAEPDYIYQIKLRKGKICTLKTIHWEMKLRETQLNHHG